MFLWWTLTKFYWIGMIPLFLICLLFVGILTSLLATRSYREGAYLYQDHFGPLSWHSEMPRRRHETWHPSPSQYTDTEPTCRCAIHFCVEPHWKAQLPKFKSWVWPGQRRTFLTCCARSGLYYYMLSRQCTVRSPEERLPYQPGIEPGSVACESSTKSARPRRLL